MTYSVTQERFSSSVDFVRRYLGINSNARLDICINKDFRMSTLTKELLEQASRTELSQDCLSDRVRLESQIPSAQNRATLVCGEKEFLVDRIQLSLASEYFTQLFFGPYKEAGMPQIDMSEMLCEEEVVQLLKFLCTREIENNQMAIELFGIANKVILADELKQLIKEYLLKSLTEQDKGDLSDQFGVKGSNPLSLELDYQQMKASNFEAVQDLLSELQIIEGKSPGIVFTNAHHNNFDGILGCLHPKITKLAIYSDDVIALKSLSAQATSQLAHIVSQCQELKRLEIPNFIIDRDNINVLIKSLAENTSIEELHIGSSSEEIPAAQSIEHCKHLKVVVLHFGLAHCRSFQYAREFVISKLCSDELYNRSSRECHFRWKGTCQATHNPTLVSYRMSEISNCRDRSDPRYK